MRIIEETKNGRLFWIIYGICKKCNMVIITNLFLDKEPIQNTDYIIDYYRVVERTKKPIYED